MIMNGKCGGTHIPFTPMAMMNDDLLDLLVMEGHFSHLFSGLSMLRNAKDHHGLHVYSDNMKFFRGTKVKFTNLNYEDNQDELVDEIDGNVISIQKLKDKKPQMF
jgi:competence protein ComGF